MTIIRIAGCVACLAVLVTACASRPSEADLTGAILTAATADPEVDLTEEQAACIARSLLGSDLSDTTLSGMAADFDNPQVLQTEADEVKVLVERAATMCV